MKKSVLALVILWLINATCFATTINLNSAVMNGFNSHLSNTQNQNALSIIYGGQDISRAKIAIANESMWTGQPRLIL